jgi:hypothetical protein
MIDQALRPPHRLLVRRRPAHQVAEAEGVAEVTVREIRKALGRGAELGGTRDETLLGAGRRSGQLSLAGYDGMMRANRGVRL